MTVGPWAHLYPHEAIPAPAVGFLQEALRWWDRWLKGRDLGVMSEAPFSFYMMDAIGPQSSHAARAGRWIAEERWPSPNVSMRTFTLNADGLEERPGERRLLTVRSPQSTGLASGDWGSFGNPGDVPGDQREDSSGSLEFTAAPLTRTIGNPG